jgi:hypothetical protein
VSTRTVGDLLAARLRRLGVSRIYGRPLGGLEHVGVQDPDLACLLADVDGRLGHHDGSGRLGAALLAGPLLHLSSRPGGTTGVQVVGSVDDLVAALADPPGMAVPGTSALHLDLDLEEPVAVEPAPPPPDRYPVLTLDPSLRDLSVVCVVGPGVVRANALQPLESFSRKAGVGVLNSWGAKGVERWDSPFHFGTIGLQARDVALAGLPEADVVVASGLDPDELGPDGLGSWTVQEVPPAQLHALCRDWEPVRTLPVRPPLYDTLAGVVTPLYEATGTPLSPARASLHLSGALPDRGVAVADPGPAGFWVARTFPTSIPGSVCVPATRAPGFAAAAALVCALEGRPCLAVTDAGSGDGPVDPTTAAVLELARGLGTPVALQVWGPDGSELTAPAHVELLRELLAPGPDRVVPVRIDLDATAELERVAGPVVAW